MQLGESMKRLSDDIVVSHNERTNFMNRLREDTDDLITDFRETRGKNSKDQKKALVDFAKNLAKDVDEILGDNQTNRKNMSKELKSELENFVGENTKNVDKILNEYQSDIKEARKAWRSLSSLSKSPKIEAKASVAAATDEVKEKNKIMIPLLKKQKSKKSK